MGAHTWIYGPRTIIAQSTWPLSRWRLYSTGLLVQCGRCCLMVVIHGTSRLPRCLMQQRIITGIDSGCRFFFFFKIASGERIHIFYMNIHVKWGWDLNTLCRYLPLSYDDWYWLMNTSNKCCPFLKKRLYRESSLRRFSTAEKSKHPEIAIY